MRKLTFLTALLLPLALLAGPNWKDLAKTHPHAMSILEEYSESYDVAADGTYKAETHYRATILKEQAISKLAKYQDSYYKGYDKLTVRKAVVVTPEGKTITVDKKNIKDIPMPAFGPFYLQNIRLVIISFPHLTVGSTVDVIIDAVRANPPMNDQFNLIEGLQTQDPIVKQSYSVTLPSNVHFAWKVLRGEAEFKKEVKGDKTTYTWVKNDVPQIVPEPSMPPMPEVAPTILASTIADWPTVSRWYYNICKEGQKTTPEIDRMIEEVTKGKTTQDEKIRALYIWASQNIRYVETTMSGEKAGFKPEPAAVTFKNRYGVCRDKAQFLTTLLRHIHVDAYITLISAYIKQDVVLPNIAFNHAIVAVAKKAGGYYFLDPTAEDSRQFLPFADQDKHVLVCRPEGEDILNTPLTPPDENEMVITLKTTLDKDGTLKSDVFYKPSGFYDFIFRSVFNKMPPERRSMVFKALVGQIIPNAQVADFSISDMDDLMIPVTVSFTVTAANQVIDTGKYLVFKAPSQGNNFDFLFSRLLWGASLEKRTYPLWLLATMGSKIEETLTLPEGYEVWSHPDPIEMDKDAISLTSTYDAHAGTLKHVEEFKLFAHIYQDEGYNTLRNILAMSEKTKSGRIILVHAKGGK